MTCHLLECSAMKAKSKVAPRRHLLAPGYRVDCSNCTVVQQNNPPCVRVYVPYHLFDKVKVPWIPYHRQEFSLLQLLTRNRYDTSAHKYDTSLLLQRWISPSPRAHSIGRIIMWLLWIRIEQAEHARTTGSQSNGHGFSRLGVPSTIVLWQDSPGHDPLNLDLDPTTYGARS